MTEHTEWWSISSVAKRLETLDGPALSDACTTTVVFGVQFGPGRFDLYCDGDDPAAVHEVRWVPDVALTGNTERGMLLGREETNRVMPYLRRHLRLNHQGVS